MGFNAGHSSLLWLETLPDARVVAFDKGEKWTKGGLLFLRTVYARRHRYIRGLSSNTLPKCVPRPPLPQGPACCARGGHGGTRRVRGLRLAFRASFPGEPLTRRRGQAVWPVMYQTGRAPQEEGG